MAAAYTAAPQTAPTPMPTVLPLIFCELPESPPIGAPSPAVPDDVSGGLYALEVPVLASKFAPGRMGMVGLIMFMSMRTASSGQL